MITIPRPSPCRRCTCATGRIFTSTPTTTRWIRSTPPSCAASHCWAPPPATASPPSMARGAPALLPFFAARAQERLAQRIRARAGSGAGYGTCNRRTPCSRPAISLRRCCSREQAALQSLAVFTQSAIRPGCPILGGTAGSGGHADTMAGAQCRAARGSRAASVPAWHATPEGARIPARIGEFGPLTYQNDDVLLDRLGAGARAQDQAARCRIRAGCSMCRTAAAIYAYEIVNFVDGKKNRGEIRDAVAAEFGPIPLELVSRLPAGLRGSQNHRISIDAIASGYCCAAADCFRPLHALGVDHRAVQFDDDGIDVIDAIVDFHGLFRAQYERGFRQSIGARGIRVR